MKLKNKIIGAIATGAILIPTLAMVVSCSCGSEDDPGPTPPGPGPGPTPDPVNKIEITFDADGQEGVTFTKSSISVKEGTKFSQIRYQSEATKEINGNKYLFLHWYVKGDSQRKEIEDSKTFSSATTLCPLFETDPIQPDSIIVSFTPAPGDEEFVTISPQTVELEEAASFATIADDVEVHKVKYGNEWDFKWWYREGYQQTSPMSEDAIVTQNITVHPFFWEPDPVKECTITVIPGEQDGVTITQSSETGIYKVTEGTSFSDFLTENIPVDPSKSIGPTTYDFKYWTMDSVVPPEDDPRYEGEGAIFYKPTEIVPEEFIITDDMVINPFFTDPAKEWKDKTVKWEDDVNKHFALGEGKNGMEISNFMLADNDTERKEPVVLGENDTLKAWVTRNDTDTDQIFKDAGTTFNLTTETEVVVDGSKIRVPIIAENLPTGDYYINHYLYFDVHFQFYWNGIAKGPKIDIGGLQYTFTQPIEEAAVEYHAKSGDIQEYNAYDTNGVLIHSSDATWRETPEGYFVLNRKLGTDEDIRVEITDLNDDPIQNLESNVDVVTVEDEGGEKTTYIDLGVYFKRLESLFEYHRVQFKLKFVVFNKTSGDEWASEIPNTFQLQYVPDKEISPYKMSCKKEIECGGMTNKLSFPVQIENNEQPYFESSDYFVMEVDAGEQQEVWPIFTSPQRGARFYGNDSNIVNFDVEFSGSIQNPPEKTVIPVDLTFTFWRDGDWVNEVKFTITFVYKGLDTNNEDLDQWASAQSVGIVQTAVKNGITETSLGTGWIVSHHSIMGDREPVQRMAHFATSYDVQADYKKFEGNEYSNHRFGLAFYPSAKARSLDDDTPYIILDDDGTEQYEEDNNDVIEYYPSKAMFWNPSEKFVWNTPYALFYRVAPNLAVFEIDLLDYIETESNEKIVKNYANFIDSVCYYNYENRGVGAGKISEDDMLHGRVISLYENTDEFSSSQFAYGYTGGFSSKDLTLPTGKKAKALYWKSFTMPMGGDYLTKLDWLLYRGGCNDGLARLYGNVYHISNAFVMLNSSFKESEYFDDAGRGAMFILREKVHGGSGIGYPMVAGINWNGGSRLNKAGHITPYFDIFVDPTDEKGNLLKDCWTYPWNPV